MLDPQQLDEIEARAKAATAGVWKPTHGVCPPDMLAIHGPRPVLVTRLYGGVESMPMSKVDWSKTVEWCWPEEIADAVNAADPTTALALVAEVRRLTDERDRMREALEEYVNEENWRLGGRFDVNSSHFDGIEVARGVLPTQTGTTGE